MLLIRADANVSIGTGHIMRCLALAQAWQAQGGEVTFACCDLTEPLSKRLELDSWAVQRITSPKGTLQDAQATSDLAKTLGAQLIVVDGYHFNADYQDKLKSQGYGLLFVDDYGHCDHYSADLILNQNLGSRARLYSNRSPETKVLLGTQFALLRNEFLSPTRNPRVISRPPRRLLVTLGGSDPDNVTRLVLSALDELATDKLEVQAVVGGSNPHLQSISQAILDSRHEITIKHDVKDMSTLMDWADVAISAGGSSNWEMCRAGLPRVVLCLAENQKEVCRQLDLTGAAIYAGSVPQLSAATIAERLRKLMNSEDLFRNMAIVNHALVDGRGSERVCNAIRKYLTGDHLSSHSIQPSLHLRPANEHDLMTLFNWANDSEVRKYSFTESKIEIDEHKAWFEKRINSRSTKIYIAEDDQFHRVGQIRFEFEDTLKEAIVGVSIDQAFRGKSFGREIIRLGMDAISQEFTWEKIVAKIRITNERSLKAFLSNDFQMERAVLDVPIPYWILTR